MPFVHTPGLKVVAPATAYDAKGLIKVGHPRQRPGALLRAQGALSPHQRRPARRGLHGADRQGAVRARGRTTSASSPTARWCTSRWRQPKQLAAEGIAIEVLDLRTLAAARRRGRSGQRAKKTSKVILLHEDTLTGGLGGELAGLITEQAFEYLDGPVVRIDGARYAGALQPAARGSLSAECRQSGRKGALAASLLTAAGGRTVRGRFPIPGRRRRLRKSQRAGAAGPAGTPRGNRAGGVSGEARGGGFRGGPVAEDL